MRSDNDKRTENEMEIDDFLSLFDTPDDAVEPDVNSYLGAQEPVMDREDFINKYNIFDQDTLDSISSRLEQIKHDKPARGNARTSDLDSTNVYDTNMVSHKRKAGSDPYKTSNVDSFDLQTLLGAYDASDISSREKQSNVNLKRQGQNTKVKKSRKNKTGKSKTISKQVSGRLSGNIDKADLKHVLLLKENPHYNPDKGAAYVLAGKKIKNTPYIVSFKKIICDCIGLMAALCLCFIVFCSFSILFGPRFDFHNVYAQVDQSSIIYDDEGKQVDQVFYDQNRKIIKYEDMPEDLVNSFVALEDKTFWKHHGFNWVRMAGAVVTSLTGGGQISGTSTITQQLARNVYLADIKSVRSIRRKVMEMYYASRLESSLSKEEIVEAYLNTIYLGYGCYGVGSASKAYYSKNVKELNLVECASLAALPQAPDTYALVQCVDPTSVNVGDKNIIKRKPDTYIANDTSKGRRNICLDFMKEQGYITDADYSDSYDKDLINFINPTFSSGNGDNSYFHEYLVVTIITDLMDKYGMERADAERMINTKGLKIYSTMDSTAQTTIVKEFNNPANYPGVRHRTDSEGNIISDDGVLLLYKYGNFFDDNGYFEFESDEATRNSDGSVTINFGHRLNIYTTTSNGQTDYSLEFKQTYTTIDGVLYAIPGGYVNIPAEYKTLDSAGNLVISAQFFTDYPDNFSFKDGKIRITQSGYSLPNKTIQPQSAMVIVGVGTGEVKAMVGGRSTKGQRLLNRAINPRQPGSSIKPLAVYGAALQKSYELEKAGKEWDYTDYKVDKQGTKGWGAYITTHSSVADERCIVNGEIWPRNSGGKFTGSNTFMTAIQQSLNTCAFKIQLQVGVDYSIQMLEKFNLSTIVTDETEEVNDLNPAALALGGMTNGVMPLEMALAYATFPAGGEINSPICYTKVIDRDGKTILTGKSKTSDVMDEGVSWIMTNVLQSVVTRGIAGGARVSNVQSGGKTGTTNDQYDIWFDGFTPTYAASLWIGTDNNIALTTLSGPAASLWGKIMKQIPKACTGVYKERPSNVIQSGGYYYTQGTEKKLSKYTPKEDEAKAKKAQKAAWNRERENHKHWVVDTPAREEKIHHDAVTESVQVGTNPDTGKPIYEEKVVTPAYEETVQIDEVGHWEYDEGWRNGDFKFDSSKI